MKFQSHPTFVTARGMVVWLGLLLAPAIALADASIDSMLREGLDFLRQRNYQAALAKFVEAERKDPTDPRAQLFEGVTLNRLGRYPEAFIKLELAEARMRSAKPTAALIPRIDFEIGRSAMGTGAWEIAIKRLTRYEERKPGAAKTSEFLGRAYLGAGRLDLAETHLREAIARDPGVKESAQYFLALVERSRGRTQGAARQLRDLMRENPDSQIVQALRNRLRQLGTERQIGKPWFIALAVSGGRNDNVIGVPDGGLTPPDISAKDSNFVRTQIDAGYGWRLDDASAVNVGYGLFADSFTDLSDFSSQTHSVYADYRRRVVPDVILGARLFADWLLIDLDSARGRAGVEPAAAYRWDRDNVSDLIYSFSVSNYIGAPFREELDRDSRTHVVTLKHGTRLDPVELDLQLGVSHAENDANGGDYDFESEILFMTLRRQVFRKVVADISFSYARDKYKNLNSLAGAGFSFKRRDIVRRLTIRLSRPITIAGNENVIVFGRYNYTDNKSNVPHFNYDQVSFDLGFSVRF